MYGLRLVCETVDKIVWVVDNILISEKDYFDCGICVFLGCVWVYIWEINVNLLVACLFIWRISCTHPSFSFCSHDDCFELIWKLKKVPGIIGTFSLILFPWNHTDFSTHFVLLHFGFCFVHIILNNFYKFVSVSIIWFYLHMEYVFCIYVYLGLSALLGGYRTWVLYIMQVFVLFTYMLFVIFNIGNIF